MANLFEYFLHQLEQPKKRPSDMMNRVKLPAAARDMPALTGDEDDKKGQIKKVDTFKPSDNKEPEIEGATVTAAAKKTAEEPIDLSKRDDKKYETSVEVVDQKQVQRDALDRVNGVTRRTRQLDNLENFGMPQPSDVVDPRTEAATDDVGGMPFDESPDPEAWQQGVELTALPSDTAPPVEGATITKLSRLEAARNDLAELRRSKPTRDDAGKGFWGLVGDMFREAVIGGGEAWRMSGGDTGATIGGMIGGAGVGAWKPEAQKLRQWERKKAEKEAEVDELQEEDLRFRQQQRAKRAEDREERRVKVSEESAKSLKEDRVERRKEREKKNKSIRWFKWRNNRKKFDHKNATKSDIDFLKEYGKTPEDVGSWDETKPNVRVVAGTSYQWDGTRGVWTAAKGLPDDASKKLISYEVTYTDPETGETRVLGTYEVPQVKAAEFQAAIGMQGRKARATKNRQDDRLEARRREFSARMKAWYAGWKVRRDNAKSAMERRKVLNEYTEMAKAIRRANALDRTSGKGGMSDEELDKELEKFPQ